MFSYRHAFHAGNHADVLKHLCLIACLDHLMLKPTPLTLIDTHAGAGSYTLDGAQARTSAEADHGVLRLLSTAQDNPPPAAVARYIEVLSRFNSTRWHTYPGSPRILHSLMRAEAGDRLRLFELHPTDSRLLRKSMETPEQPASHVTVTVKDGFEGLKALLPPPAGPGGSKRALVLMDPSYELKTDYARVSQSMQDALKRFANGCYLVWYPIIARPEAHQLPRRLKTLANQAGRTWLHASLSIGQAPGDEHAMRGLTASGMFVINPPHVLAEQLRESAPWLLQALGQGKGQALQVDTSA